MSAEEGVCELACRAARHVCHSPSCKRGPGDNSSSAERPSAERWPQGNEPAETTGVRAPRPARYTEPQTPMAAPATTKVAVARGGDRIARPAAKLLFEQPLVVAIPRLGQSDSEKTKPRHAHNCSGIAHESPCAPERTHSRKACTAARVWHQPPCRARSPERGRTRASVPEAAARTPCATPSAPGYRTACDRMQKH